MDMAEYILSVLKAQIIIMWSWGFNNPTAIEDGLQFNVQGFKFKGIVKVIYDHAMDLFKVEFVKDDEVVKTIEDVYVDQLVEVIDNYVERTENYFEDIEKEYLAKE
jgi:hypothetical protein